MKTTNICGNEAILFGNIVSALVNAAKDHTPKSILWLYDRMVINEHILFRL